jgi:hypothetical protein
MFADARREYQRQYREDNKQKRIAQFREWCAANKELRAEKDRQYHAANRTRRNNNSRQYYAANRQQIIANSVAYERERRQSDPLFRLLKSLRARHGQFFKGTSRPASMARDMGCDREFFLHHIAIQFTAGMTMENYGKVWHLDHIYPLSKADLTDRAQFLAAANWRNIQPMLGPENVKKSDEVTPEAQALFDGLVREFTNKGE